MVLVWVGILILFFDRWGFKGLGSWLGATLGYWLFLFLSAPKPIEKEPPVKKNP